MNNQALPPGSRVYVVSYGPFRGLKGTIRKVDTIAGLEADEAFCFYLVELEGTHNNVPIWFEYDEVELVGSNLVVYDFPSSSPPDCVGSSKPLRFGGERSMATQRIKRS